MLIPIKSLAVGLTLGLVAGCVQIPTEAILASRQIEKNLDIMEENALMVADEWHELSVDYWREAVGREGPKKMIEKLEAGGGTFDPSADYEDLVRVILREYQNNFLSRLNEAHVEYRDQIRDDFAITRDAVRKIGDLLEANAKLQQQQRALLNDAKATIAEKVPGAAEVFDELRGLLGDEETATIPAPAPSP